MRRVAARLAGLLVMGLLVMGQGVAPADAPVAVVPAVPAVPVVAPPAVQELIYHGEAASLLGRTVHDPQDGSLGRIVDVLVDDAGQPRAAVIDVGGFMGMGSRRIAVAWRALRFDMAKGVGRITLAMTLDQIKDTPDYKRAAKETDPPVAVAAPPTAPAVEAPASVAVPPKP